MSKILNQRPDLVFAEGSLNAERWIGGFQTLFRKSVKFSDLSKIVGQSSRTPKMVTIGVFKTWIAIS